MVELPENEKLTSWLFPDNITAESYKFLGFVEHESKNEKKIPCLLLYGQTKNKDEKIRNGEVLTAIWNIQNYDEIREQVKTISADKLFFKIKKATDTLLHFTVEEVIA